MLSLILYHFLLIKLQLISNYSTTSIVYYICIKNDFRFVGNRTVPKRDTWKYGTHSSEYRKNIVGNTIIVNEQII